MDEKKKVLLALQCVNELTNKKRAALLDLVEDPTELLEPCNRQLVFKTLGDEHATEFFANLQKADALWCELEKRDIRSSLDRMTNILKSSPTYTTLPLRCLSRATLLALKQSAWRLWGQDVPQDTAQRLRTNFQESLQKRG